MSVCVPAKNFGAAWRLQKCSDLTEILEMEIEIFDTWSLVKYLGVIFSFFENFDFWGLGTSFFSQNKLILAKKLWGSLETSKMFGFG